MIAMSNASTLSQTIDIWATVVNSAPDHFMQQLSQRRKMASSGVQLAAYLIDHRFCGKSLSSFETAGANAYIESLGDDLIPETIKFIAKEPPYSASLFEGS